MTGKNVTGQRRTSQGDQRRPASLVPKVTFGLGVAVLTGVAVVTVPSGHAATGVEYVVTTSALGAPINGAGIGDAAAQTTCCGPN